MPADHGFLTLNAIAKRYGVPIGTVYSWRSRGSLPEPAEMVLNHPLWREEQFEGWQRPVRGRPRKADTSTSPASTSDSDAAGCEDEGPHTF